ncbi:serine hydrolase [Kordiimonas sp. SCSIO 12603]|uniref:serine hydrolase n=1 Tax=Kordiimonas sp. SCSIO 12603 TaxID=2829596 RepID=UPI002106BAAD|nr:serine hydrolase [Kordiimonas sp. SCSIO 12603]UTW59542.1 serine hydrolase [Kordiimonas sp. SCSIO 12603]
MKYYLLAASVLFASGADVVDANMVDYVNTSVDPTIEIAQKIPELMKVYGVSGLAATAVKGDKVLFSQGFGVTSDGQSYSSSTSCGLYSATKVLASLTYANLAKDGRINMEGELADYIEDAPEAWRKIPFYRLLNHTSGITMAVNKSWFGELVSNPSTQNADIYQKVRDIPLDYKPGEFSRYRQSGYAVAEMILKNKLGVSFADIALEYLTSPANMTNTKHPSVSDDSQPAFLLSAGGFVTTADDMSKLFIGINNGAVIAPQEWKAFLLNQDYRFKDYSLGSLIEERDGILTMGHSGGGARANIRYAPDEKVGVMICTDDRSNKGLAIPLARMLMHEIVTGEVPPLPLLTAFGDYKAMNGVDIISVYKQAKERADGYDFSDAEALLNNIGYTFLSDKRVEDAIQVFKLNVQEHPNSGNVYDSLGEAQLTAGDKLGALASYQQAVALDPHNQGAAKAVKKLLQEK